MMNKNRITHIFLIVLFITTNTLFSQTSACNGVLPFEEKDGLLTIEMESGVLPSGSNWQKGSESDPNVSGATIDYIFWNGTESFNRLSGAPITYNIKINNPGTYRFAWRGRIGRGTSRGEHNDAWLRIEADDFFATKQNSPTSTEVVEPRPNCNNNPNRNCPEGSSTEGFFKAFMNRSPTGPEDQRWGFVTNANDGDSFRFIWATFNTPGNYSVIVDARSNSFFIDKMVLRRSNVSDSTAFNLNNPESSCFDASLSTDEISATVTKFFPNPTKGKLEISNLPLNTTLIISNIYGATIRTIQTTLETEIIDLSDLQSGVYFISNSDKKNGFVKKIVKI
ncbi:T9SS type A sorting domain-containing protein [uncultured Polaribacter sp.]|uniref:T9SS type A sorting domain-containing protein n=1 Tax=uncultured Polaribacter sp. TaxID=174711 RepID=UPI002607382C|nr:T9SS type A sorting domain-containing protein [uncultured Polaribacter sp.]